MASEVPLDGHEKSQGGFRQYVRQLLSHSAHALPLIAAFASLTLVLDTHFDFFRVFDEHVVGFAASRQANHDDVNMVFSAWVVSPQLFSDAKAFKRTLPVDKEKLGEIIGRFTKARAVAIDVEAIPQDKVLTGPDLDNKEVKGLPMFKAIMPLLRQGVNVVLLSSGNQKDEVSAFYWRRSFCAAAKSVADAAKSGARLWWATGYLETQGSGMSVLRYFSPEQSKKRVNAGIDEGLLPLGVVLAVAAGEAGRFQASLATDADYCTRQSDTQPPVKVASGAARAAQVEHADKPTEYINYFSDRPLEISIESMGGLPQGGPLEVLKRGAIVLGVRTPDGIDIHGTPVAPMLGAHLHAMVAASVGKPVSQSHGWAYLVDIVVGYLFVVFFHAFQDIRAFVIRKWFANAPSAQRLVSLACPIAALLATCVLLMLAPLAAAYGLWLNPVPMLLGVLAHFYLELIDPPQAGHVPSVRKSLGDWVVRARQVFTLTTQSDNVAWTAIQVATFGFILFAGYLLTQGH